MADEDRECKRCGDPVQYLSTDNLCDGCVEEEESNEEPPEYAQAEIKRERDNGGNI